MSSINFSSLHYIDVLNSVYLSFFLFNVVAALFFPSLGHAIGLGSAFTGFYTGTFVAATKWLAKFFIAMAMCAIGLNTDIVKFIKKSGKPILMGFVCWIAITVVSLGVQLLTGIYYTNL